MPYTVKKNEKGEFCVHKKDEDGEATGESLGCHESMEKASAQIGAIESSENKQDDDEKESGKKSADDVVNTVEPVVEHQEEPVDDISDEIDPRYAVKALGAKRLGAYGILWGDEENKDLHKEWFDRETRDLKSIFDAMGKIPLIVHHAADEDVKSFVYGEVDVLEEDDTGLWWEAKIKEFKTYRKYVQPLLDRRAMFSSSGTLPAAKRVEKSGRITRWPVAEMTTTWIPAEWRMLERPVDEIKAAYKAIDLNYDFTDVEDEDNDAIGAAKARLSLIADSYLREIELIEETL
jgi:hypothetical protein